MKRKADLLQNKKFLLCTVILMSVLLLLVGIGTTVAKYITEIKADDHTVRAGTFYFTSDLLDGGTHTVSPGSVTFKLKNHADELRYSEVDIVYTVTVDNGGTVDQSSGTISKGAINDKTITLSGLESGKTYTVTAKANAPYQKTLTATLKVTDSDNEVHYEVKDNGTTVEVTVWTVDYEGNIEITYGAGLIPDNTDEKMSAWTAGAQTKQVRYEKNQSHTYRFFKVGEGTTVTVSKEGGQ